MTDTIDVSFNEDDAKLLLQALKGDLVRNNSLNFEYLNRVTSIGLYIEKRLRGEDII